MIAAQFIDVAQWYVSNKKKFSKIYVNIFKQIIYQMIGKKSIYCFVLIEVHKVKFCFQLKIMNLTLTRYTFFLYNQQLKAI